MTNDEKKILIETVPVDEDLEMLVDIISDKQANIEVYVSE